MRVFKKLNQSQTEIIMEMIQKEIQEAINKNLPSAVGDELKLVLEKAKSDASEVSNLTTQLKRKTEESVAFDKENQKLRQKLSKHDELDTKKLALDEQECNLVIKELTFELNAEKRLNVSLDKALLGLVRNTEFKSTSMTPLPYSNSSSGYTNTGYAPQECKSSNIAE